MIIQNKKGISVMVGYILLISIAIIISIFVYQWISTYIPKQSLQCPEGVSVFVDEYIYDCVTGEFNLTIKNNGRFNVAGYFIHATTESDQELAVTDLSGYTEKGDQGSVNYWKFLGGPNFNPIETGKVMKDNFSLSSVGIIYSIEMIPIRYEVINNRNRPVSCSAAKIKEEIVCNLCGNGVIDAGEGEECDDGNKANGDGCSYPGCQVESGWDCIDNPSPPPASDCNPA